MRKLCQLLGVIFTGKFNQQQGIRLTAHKTIHGGTKHRNLPRQLDHGAVNQLHCARIKLDDVLGRCHRLVERREVAHTQHLVRRNRLQIKLQTGKESERTLGTDQQSSQVARTGIDQLIDVVTTDAAQQFRKAEFDFFCLTAPQLGQPTQQLGRRPLFPGVLQSPEVGGSTIG